MHSRSIAGAVEQRGVGGYDISWVLVPNFCFPVMSIDLEWSKLDSSLSSHLVSLLNRQLASAPRPSFIGPVQVTSLDFGSTPPDIELVDLRDIYRDFTEDDDSSVSSSEPVKVSEGPGEENDDEPYEWISRRAAGRGQDLFADGFYRPNVYSGHGRMDMFSSTPSLGGMNMPGLAGFRPTFS
jgi:distribution and morphology protein 12